MNAKYAFINSEEGNYPVRSMCRWARFTMLVHLPREEGYRHRHSVKNGPRWPAMGRSR